MKRVLIFCLAAVMAVSFTGCKLEHMDSDNIYDFMLGLAEKAGCSQITGDEALIGIRKISDDAYTGTYWADCDGSTGRDVIFGGGSIESRSLCISGFIQTRSGKATVRIRLNAQVSELTPDKNGFFETKLSLKSGGNYIMLQYKDFEGTVELESKYTGNITKPII